MFIQLNNKFINLNHVAYIELEKIRGCNQTEVSIVFQRGGSLRVIRENKSAERLINDLRDALNKNEQVKCINP